MTNPKPLTNYRWTICSLIFFATTINYLDRSVIGLLKTDLSAQFHWTETDYANIVVAFQIFYAIGLIGFGRLIDKFGTKIGYATVTTLWSISEIMHAAVTSTFGFKVARGSLGLFEAGNFPVAIKTVAEWFPKKERAFATGLFNTGANVGAVLAPLTVPFIAAKWGWQWAFILTGAVGFIWLILWFKYYELPKRHKKLSTSELEYILQDDKDANAEELKGEKSNWFQLLKIKETWAFSLGKFLTDPIWWFYLFWLPDYLEKQGNLTATQVAIPLAVAYAMVTVGSIYGGWLPMYFIKKGKSVYAARKRAMFLCALAVIPVFVVQYFAEINIWFAVLFIGIAMAAHQAWSANLFTTVSDSFSKKNVSSIVGIGSMFGSVGAVIVAKLAGSLFDHYKATGDVQQGYFIMFIICSLAYIIAWFIFFQIYRRKKPAV